MTTTERRPHRAAGFRKTTDIDVETVAADFLSLWFHGLDEGPELARAATRPSVFTKYPKASR